MVRIDSILLRTYLSATHFGAFSSDVAAFLPALLPRTSVLGKAGQKRDLSHQLCVRVQVYVRIECAL